MHGDGQQAICAPSPRWSAPEPYMALICTIYGHPL